MTYYLGKAGALVALPDPEAGLPLTPERIGGTHQLLSGSRVRDTIGRMRTWQLNWTAINLTALGPIEGFYYGAVPGPLVFLDPEQRNLLPINVSTGTDAKQDTTGFGVQAATSLASTTDRSADFGAFGGPFPAGGSRTLQVNVPGSLASGSTLLFTSALIPVVPGLSYTLSGAIENLNTITFGTLLTIGWVGSDGVTWISSTVGSTVAANAVGKSTATGTAPANTYWASVVLQTTAGTSTASAVYLDGLQLEQASTASTWVPGTGVPLVTVESMSRTTPLAGICDAQMTLAQVG